MQAMLAVFVLVAAAATLVAAQTGCGGTPNTHPVWNGNLQSLRTVQNGKLYLAGNPGNTLWVIQLYGDNAYDRGFAMGQLMRNEIEQMVPMFYQYLDQQIAPYIKKLPLKVQEIIEKDGTAAALQFTADLTAPYTPQHFFDELHGLADGMNGSVSYEMLLQVNMLPELIKASCSMFGAWGPALANTTSKLTQLRALDWGLDSPLYNFTAVIVYHPAAGDGHTFSTVTWIGFVGTVTAYSGVMGVSEKVWDAYNETSSRAGIPFHFLLRDIAQYDNVVEDSLNRIYNNRRTCSIHIGLGSNYSSQFRVVEYSLDEVFVYNDENYPAYLPQHPLMEGVVFIDKHVQPSQDPCMGEIMQTLYGNYTGENTIKYLLGPFQTGDIHSAFYDFTNNYMYVGVAGAPISPSGQPLPGPIAPAYARPWFKFNMNTLFSETQ